MRLASVVVKVTIAPSPCRASVGGARGNGRQAVPPPTSGVDDATAIGLRRLPDLVPGRAGGTVATASDACDISLLFTRSLQRSARAITVISAPCRGEIPCDRATGLLQY
jgi:hypothetical protein